MAKEDKTHAEKVFMKNHSMVDQVDKIAICISPGAIKIHFKTFTTPLDY
ncbi:hypothetical protein ACT7CZ_18115 [Bacillus cereus]